MSTLHHVAEAAVRRDLHRARVVLASGIPLQPDRRRALADHLTWISTLISTADPVVHGAASGLHAAAQDYHGDGERPRRLELLAAVGSLHRSTAHRDRWLADGALEDWHEHVPWLFDGARRAPGIGLVGSADARTDGRERAEAYRRRRLELWGPVVLARV